MSRRQRDPIDWEAIILLVLAVFLYGVMIGTMCWNL